MVEQHSKDYKLSALKYYLTHNKTMRDVCNKIFNCKIQSLSRWKIKYNKDGNIKRKERQHKNTKITPEIITFVKSYVKLYPTTTLWEFSKLIETDNDLLYSVPYHPETNAIEEFFSQLKHYIKKESPNTYEDIERVIKEIINTKIKREHLTNYLKDSFRMYKNK